MLDGAKVDRETLQQSANAKVSGVAACVCVTVPLGNFSQGNLGHFPQKCRSWSRCWTVPRSTGRRSSRVPRPRSLELTHCVCVCVLLLFATVALPTLLLDLQHWWNFYIIAVIYFCQLSVVGRPDITVMVDWALKINYLFVVVGSLTCTCLWHTGTQVFISFGLIRRDILPVP